MTEITRSVDGIYLQMRTRRAALHATGLLTIALPVGGVVSFLIAQEAGAQRPEAAALLTALLSFLGATVVVYGLLNRQVFPHDRLGLCNVITLSRGIGIAVMAGLVLAPVAKLGWTLVAMSGVLLALDGVDGWAARRARLQSQFGARLDVETDVAFAFTLAALAVALGQVGIWFLALGLLRPAYLLAGRVWPALQAPLPDAKWRKRMAAIQMTVQVSLLAPILSPPVTTWMGALLLAAMVISFGIDIFSQLRRASSS